MTDTGLGRIKFRCRRGNIEVIAYDGVEKAKLLEFQWLTCVLRVQAHTVTKQSAFKSLLFLTNPIPYGTWGAAFV